jgi:streptogramin lyase
MKSRRSTVLLAGAAGLALAATVEAAAFPRAVARNVAPPTTAMSKTARHGWMPPNAKSMKLLYVSDYTESLILAYQQGRESSGPIGEIVDGISTPQGIAVDSSGTLYVANQGNDTITEYPAGASEPTVTLSSGIDEPLDVAVGEDSVLYVTEGSADKIVEFAEGATSPSESITITHPSDGVTSKNSDLYATNNLHFSSAGGEVVRCKPLERRCESTGISVGYAQGITIDSQGNLLVGDYYHEEIDVFPPGSTSPSRQIALTYQEPGKLALNKNDSVLYMCDPADFAVDLINYSTGAITSTFTYGPSDELEGLALYPGQKPGKP